MLPRDAGPPDPSRKMPEPKLGPRLRTPVPGSSHDGTLPPWQQARAALPPALASGTDARALVKAFGRRWPMAVALGLIAAAAAGTGAWYVFTARYVVYAQVLVGAPKRIVYQTNEGGDSRGDVLAYQRTQAATLKSRFVLSAALKRDEVKRLAAISQQPDPITWLDEELRVEFKEGSELITAFLTGEDSAETVTLLNAVVQAYLKEVDSQEHKQRSDRMAELDTALTKSREKLRGMRESQRRRAEELGTTDSLALNQRQQSLLQSFGELRQQHTRAQIDLMRSQNKLNNFKTQANVRINAASIEAVVNDAIDADTKVRTLSDTVADVQRRIERYQSTAVDPYETTLVRLRGYYKQLTHDLQARKDELRKDLTARAKQDAQLRFDTELARYQDEYNSAFEMEKKLQAEVAVLEKDVNKVGGSIPLELQNLGDEIKQEEDGTKRIAQEYQALQVELRRPPRVTLYQDAAVQRKDIKRQVLGVGLSPLVAFLAVCFCVALIESRSRRIHTADEVVHGLGLRVVGAVPPSGRRVANLRDEDGFDPGMLESIDAIRTQLLRDASLELTRLVMVTSAVEGEGKTTLAGHLACSLARAGRRTLLVDCDLRCPAAHQLFELPMQPGFSEVLLGEVPADDAIMDTPIDGLWLMPAGQWDREVIQALAKDGVEQMFERFKEQFDFVIVDSHPVLAATDSLLIGQHVDAVILSLQRDVSQTPRVYAAGQRLTSLGVRVLGAVVNGLGQDDLIDQGYQAPVEAA